MSKAEQIRDYVALHPGSSNNQIADGTGLTPAYVATCTGYMYKNGTLSRTATGQTLSGVVVYSYSMGQEKKPKPQKQKNVVLSEPKVETLDSLVDSFVNAFADRIAQGIAAKLKDVLPAKVQELLPQPPKVSSEMQVLTAPVGLAIRRRHVAIVGLTPQQIALINDEFKDSFELTFWSSDGAGDGEQRLKSLAIACNKVFVNANMVSHKHANTLTAMGACYQKFGGGLTQLRSMLHQYYKDES